jgi:predicted AAA+ superfamily ATPase
MEYLKRDLNALLNEIIITRPLIYLNGPRQVGKSTLAQSLQPGRESNYISFDSPLILARAKADPEGFIKSLPQGKLNIIDEIQLAPELFRYLKISVDENRLQGKNTALYLLTGSANLLALPKLSDALAGRMSVLTLLPFSSAEYKQTGINFIERLFADKLEYRKYKDYDLTDIITNATFPEIALNLQINRAKWFDDYLTTILQRDVKNIVDIRNPDKIIMLLSILSMRAAGLLNNSLVSVETGIDNKTYEKYKTAVVNAFLIFELKAWAKPERLNKRFAKSSKLFFNDTNLLVYLMKRDIKEIYKNKEPLAGRLFENFIATEIMKNASSLVDVGAYHFRTADKKEADFVLERHNGDTIGIEVKLERNLNNKDFYGLRALKNIVGDKFKKGIVIYGGGELVPFGENMWALPLNYLWEGL